MDNQSNRLPTGSTGPDEQPPLLLPAKVAAKLCSTSERTWRAWDAAGLVPQPVRIGRSVFWRRTELDSWVEHGCPPRKTWIAISED